MKPIAQARVAVAGRLVFPAPSLAFCRHRPGLRGLSGTRAAHRPEPVRGSPRELDLPFKALERWRGPALADPSSLGIRKVCPLADMPAARLLPGAEAPFGPMGTSHRVLIRPRGSSPHRRFPPRGGRGFVAPRSRTRVRRVSRSPGPDARGRPKTVRSTGPSQWRSPRRGSHPSKSSLRRQPRRITAAVASLPLPSRRSGPTIRLGDAPIRRSGPPRHRARGAFTPPKRRGTAAHDPRRSKSHRSATWTGRSDQGRGGSTPSAPPRPESGRPKTRLSCSPTEAGRRGEGLHRVTEVAGCGSVESSQSGSASRPCSVDEVRCRQATVAGDRRSFLPWALFPFEVPRAAGAFRRCLAGDLRSRSLEGRTRDTRRASAPRAADQRDPSAGSPAAPGRSPSSRQHRGGRSPATDRRLFSAAVVAPVSRPRGSAGRSRFHREASARRVCPEHES